MRKKLAILLLSLATVSAAAQVSPYYGERKFDGYHKNEISGYLMGGSNVVTGPFFGQAATYTRHLTERWSISGAEQTQFYKQLYSIDATGTYRLPLRYFSLYFDGSVLFNHYHRWKTNEMIANLSVSLESLYFDMRLGYSVVHYHMNGVDPAKETDSGYTEPPVMTFGLGVNVLPRTHKWNLGLYARNYDQFYYENWNINWGVRFFATLPLDMKLYGEFNIRPAGSISQLATRYETSLKLGVKYVW